MGWVVLAVFCAVAFGVVTGLFNADEKVNGLCLVVASACFYVLAYRFYGRFLARRVLELDDRRLTPAHRLTDGANFHPTNRWVLFGHHFAAIAGAGPLLGPVLAAQFGFLPGFLWLVVGAVLAGAVQDFVILVASMRRNGRSLPQIARDEVGPVTGLATAVAVLFIVIVALAGLGLAVVNALYHNPWGACTLAMTVPIAVFLGFYLQRWRPGRVGEMSAIGAVLLLAAIIAGRAVAQSPAAAWFDVERETLVWLLMGYGLLASVLPMWDVTGAKGLSVQLYEGRRGRAPGRRRGRDGADNGNASRHGFHHRRRADHSRVGLPLSFYHHRLWRDFWISLAGGLRHNAQDD